MKGKWALTLAVFIGLAFGFLVWARPSPGVSRRNCNRIKIGMTVGEVGGIMGRPAMLGPYTAESNGHVITECLIWSGPAGEVRVVFREGKVDADEAKPPAEFTPNPDREPSTFLQDWLEAIGLR